MGVMALVFRVIFYSGLLLLSVFVSPVRASIADVEIEAAYVDSRSNWIIKFKANPNQNPTFFGNDLYFWSPYPHDGPLYQIWSMGESYHGKGNPKYKLVFYVSLEHRKTATLVFDAKGASLRYEAREPCLFAQPDVGVKTAMEMLIRNGFIQVHSLPQTRNRGWFRTPADLFLPCEATLSTTPPPPPLALPGLGNTGGL